MGHDNTVPRFGEPSFQSACAVLGSQRRNDDWEEALSTVGQWRGSSARLLSGAEAEKIEGDEIRVLQYIDHSQGLKLGIPEDASQADIEKALHTVLTIAGIASSRAREITDRFAKEHAIDDEAHDQVADVLRYIHDILCEHGKEEAARLRQFYDQYGKQVTDLILATRNGVLKDMSLLDGFFTSCPRG